ncbi:hypothetical protein ACWDBW_38635 [Streptomyces sp. NPDC001107]
MSEISSRGRAIFHRAGLLAITASAIAVLTASGTASAANAGTFHPTSADGCTGGLLHQNVCLNITGRSVFVTHLAIGNNTSKAGEGTITVNGKTKWNLGTIKGHNVVGMHLDAKLPDNANVCAHIKGVSGVPCERIEK